jgi:hypothetical protein
MARKINPIREEDVCMDPISIGALSSILTALLEGTTEAAAGKTLDSLARLLRRTRGGGSDAAQELERWTTNSEAGDAGTIATYLVEAATKDDEIARQLELWVAEARTVLAGGSVANTVSGTVAGNVIQGGDIGSVKLG